MLDEAKRIAVKQLYGPVTIREGGKTKRVPAVEAVVRSQTYGGIGVDEAEDLLHRCTPEELDGTVALATRPNASQRARDNMARTLKRRLEALEVSGKTRSCPYPCGRQSMSPGRMSGHGWSWSGPLRRRRRRKRTARLDHPRQPPIRP